MFENPLTPDELYWAGMIHADGSIERGTCRIRFVQKDRAVVEEFLKFLGQDSKVSNRVCETPFGRSETHYATGKLGGRELLNLGVKGDVDPSLYRSRHFWRGLVDGDGTVRVNRDGYAVLSLCSGKPRDVVAFSEWVGTLFNGPGPRVYVNRNGGQYVQVGGGKARALGVYLYRDGYSAVPRKRDTALSFEALATRTSVSLITFVENSCL